MPKHGRHRQSKTPAAAPLPQSPGGRCVICNLYVPNALAYYDEEQDRYIGNICDECNKARHQEDDDGDYWR